MTVSIQHGFKVFGLGRQVPFGPASKGLDVMWGEREALLLELYMFRLSDPATRPRTLDLTRTPNYP